MQHQISLREANLHFAHYIKEVERGDEVLITRHGKLVARIVPVPQIKELSKEQLEARARVLERMQKGLALKGEIFNRDSLYDR